MKPSENIEESISQRRYRATAEAYDKALGSFMQAVDDHEKQKPAAVGPNIRRIITTSRIVKLGAAAAIVVTTLSVLSHFLHDSTKFNAYENKRSLYLINQYRPRITTEINGLWLNFSTLSLDCHKRQLGCIHYSVL